MGATGSLSGMNLARILCVFGAALAMAGCTAVDPVLTTPFGGPLPTDFAVHGIDVSKYQGNIDWNRVHGSGVEFAWIKATEGGNRMDDRFYANWSGAKAAGVAHGAYHFVYWCRPWREQMAWLEQNVPVEEDALPPVLDVELTPTSPTCKRTLYREPTLTEMRGMLEEMERHYGKKPVIYTTVDFYAGILSGGALDDYPIWVRSTKYHPVGQICRSALAFLAVSVGCPHRRDQQPGRPQRLFRFARTVGLFLERRRPCRCNDGGSAMPDPQARRHHRWFGLPATISK